MLPWDTTLDILNPLLFPQEDLIRDKGAGWNLDHPIENRQIRFSLNAG